MSLSPRGMHASSSVLTAAELGLLDSQIPLGVNPAQWHQLEIQISALTAMAVRGEDIQKDLVDVQVTLLLALLQLTLLPDLS